MHDLIGKDESGHPFAQHPTIPENYSSGRGVHSLWYRQLLLLYTKMQLKIAFLNKRVELHHLQPHSLSSVVGKPKITI